MANSSYTKVLDDVSSTQNSSSLNWMGGVGQMVAAGTWDSATIKMQMSPDDTTQWVDVGTTASLTADGVVNFELGACDIRLVVTVSGTSALDGWLTDPVNV